MSGNLPKYPESILVVRLGAMGDVLHAMPAVAALRKGCPETRIGWVIERRWSELLISQDEGAATMFGSRPLINALHTVDTRAWRETLLQPATWRDIRTSVGVIRAEKYSAAIDFQGAIKSALLARVSDAGEIFGFTQPRERAATLWYTNQVKVTAVHVIDQNLQLASAIVRQPLAAESVELPRPAKAEQWCEDFLQGRGLNHFALLSPGSGWGAKCWPAERYAEVAKRLAGVGLKSLINYGPGEENLANAVVASSDGTAETASCDLAHLIALTRRASLFIGSDTGPMHLASALKIPTVALFGPTDPARNGPYWKPSIVLRSEQSVTSYKHVAAADPGLHSITSDAVVAAAAQLLGVPIG
jgi:heptosyltransferase I